VSLRAKQVWVALAAGTLFGVGLALSGMTLPRKVIGFLDVAGDWDPSLAFVMLGAVSVYAVAYRVMARRSRPLFASELALPSQRRVEPRLVVGAAIFGVGWGLAGYCPGPGITSLGSGASHAFLFVAAMLVGSYAGKQLEDRVLAPRPDRASTGTEP
jgi:uncharacterized protein